MMKYPFLTFFLNSQHLKKIECFIVVLCDNTSTEVSVNVVRKMLTAEGRGLDNIPPTQNALYQHVYPFIYQFGIRGKSQISILNAPNPNLYGWKKNHSSTWEPIWMTVAPLS